MERNKREIIKTIHKQTQSTQIMTKTSSIIVFTTTTIVLATVCLFFKTASTSDLKNKYRDHLTKNIQATDAYIQMCDSYISNANKRASDSFTTSGKYAEMKYGFQSCYNLIPLKNTNMVYVRNARNFFNQAINTIDNSPGTETTALLFITAFAAGYTDAQMGTNSTGDVMKIGNDIDTQARKTSRVYTEILSDFNDYTFKTTGATFNSLPQQVDRNQTIDASVSKIEILNEEEIKPMLDVFFKSNFCISINGIEINSQAEKCGLKTGDILISYDQCQLGFDIENENPLSWALKKPGESQAQIIFFRDGVFYKTHLIRSNIIGVSLDTIKLN